jgi:hypothetical protein
MACADDRRCPPDFPSTPGSHRGAHLRRLPGLHVTLGRRLHALAPGLTPRSVLEKFAAIQMIDVHIPTSDGGELMLTRYTEPQAELKLLLEKLRLELPAQPPPKITAL